MNNKLLKQNAIMVLYITELISSLDENIKCKEKLSYKNKYSDIKVNKEIKKYFEECLEKAFDFDDEEEVQ